MMRKYSGESPNGNETDEDNQDEQLRAIYATKCKRPPPKPSKHTPNLPLIPKEQYDQLPSEQVKETSNHAYFYNVIRKLQLETQQKPGPLRRSQNCTATFLTSCLSRNHRVEALKTSPRILKTLVLQVRTLSLMLLINSCREPDRLLSVTLPRYSTFWEVQLMLILSHVTIMDI